MRRLLRLLCTCLGATLTAALLTGPAITPAHAASTFNYAEALQKSIFFYEAQQSGQLPSWNQVTWRGPATLKDGSSAGVNLSGGWYDAGDHVKFGFPMAFTTTMLAWGVDDDRAGYVAGGQLTPMLNNLKWATDYLIAANPDPNTLYVQVGDGSVDHAYWGPPEMIDILGMSRPVYKITPSCRGTDVAAETAAAMAASAIAFRSSDPTYADTLLTHAKQLLALAETSTNVDGQENAYVKCVTAAQGYYTSNYEGGSAHPGATKMYWDELAWASAWLYRATTDATYLAKARTYYPKMGTEPEPGAGSGSTGVPVYDYGLSWNDKEYGVYVLMARLTGEQQFKNDAQRYLDYWTVGYKGAKGPYTPGGLAYVFDWGSLRMAADTAWAALDYADYLGSADPLYTRYHDFAKKQIDYALGDNPGKHSYEVGFGVNPPTHVHHRAASGQSLGYMADTTGPNRHIIYGALAGGPDQNDAWTDSRTDYQHNEVAIDYNAGFTAALARLTGEYGGTPVADSQLVDPTHDTEMSVGLTTYYSGSDGTSVALAITNTSGWPPRVLNKAVARYFFTLDGATTPSQITTSVSGTTGCTAGAPVQYSGSTYSVAVDCTGVSIYPGSTQTYQKSVQLNIKVASPGTWDSGNDWSAGGGNDVPLYDNGTLVWGSAPAGGPTTTRPVTTTTTTTVPVTTTTTTKPVTTTTTTTTRPVTTTTTTTTTTTKPVTTTTTTTVPVTTTTTTTKPVTTTTTTTVPVTTTTTVPVTTTTTTKPVTTTTTTGTDTIPPTQPGTPTAGTVTSTTIALSWAASTDNVGVSSYEVDQTNPDGSIVVLATPTTNSTTLTGLAPGTAYQLSVIAKDAAGNRSPSSSPLLVTTVPLTTTTTTTTTRPVTTTTTRPVTTTSQPGTGTCTATYSVAGQWDGGFQGQVTITAHDASIAGWLVSWTLGTGQKITQSWNATVSTSGNAVLASNQAWNGALAPGTSTSFGFIGTWSGTNTIPALTCSAS